MDHMDMKAKLLSKLIDELAMIPEADGMEGLKGMKQEESPRGDATDEPEAADGAKVMEIEVAKPDDDDAGLPGDSEGGDDDDIKEKFKRLMG